MTDFEASREGVDDLVRLKVIVDEYLTAKIRILGRGRGFGGAGPSFRYGL